MVLIIENERKESDRMIIVNNKNLRLDMLNLSRGRLDLTQYGQAIYGLGVYGGFELDISRPLVIVNKKVEQ